MKKQLVCFVILIVVFASCKQPQSLVFKDIQHFKFNGIGLGKSGGMSMDLKLYNPNRYSINVKHADIDIYVNDSYIGKVFAVKGNYKIPGTDTFLLPVKVDLDLNSVLPNAFNMLLSKKVNVKVSGKIKAGKHGVAISMPVHYEGKQEIKM